MAICPSIQLSRLLIALVALILSATFSVAAPSSPHHAIQVGVFDSAEAAEKTFFLLRKFAPPRHLAETRIEQIPPSYIVRVGRFADYWEAQELLPKIRKAFPDAFILLATWQEERIFKKLEVPASKTPAVAAPAVATPAAAVPAAAAPAGAARSAATRKVAVPAAATRKVAAPAAAAPAVSPPAVAAPAVSPPAVAARSVAAPAAAAPPAKIPGPRPSEAKVAATIAPAAKIEMPREERRGAAAEKNPEAPKAALAGTSNDWWRYGGLLIGFLAFAAVGLRLLRRKAPENSMPIVAPQDGLRTPPALSRQWEILLQKNQRELSGAEGNLLQTGRDVKTIYVTSCFHGEGKTTAAVSLAMSLAENSNKRVLLVDGNAHNPQLHALFGARLSTGLCDFSPAVTDHGTLLRNTAYPNLTLMTCGERRERQDMVEHHVRLVGLRDRFDYILVDGHSALGGSQLSLVAKHFDGILLVVQCERTKWEVVQQVKEKIDQVEGKVLGVILNKRKFYIPGFFYGRK